MRTAKAANTVPGTSQHHHAPALSRVSGMGISVCRARTCSVSLAVAKPLSRSFLELSLGLRIHYLLTATRQMSEIECVGRSSPVHITLVGRGAQAVPPCAILRRSALVGLRPVAWPWRLWQVNRRRVEVTLVVLGPHGARELKV